MGKVRTEEEVAARKAKKEAKKDAKRAVAEAKAAALQSSSKAEPKLPGGVGNLFFRLDPKHKLFDPELKAAWSKMSRSAKAKMLRKERANRSKQVERPAPPATYPYPTVTSDHIEIGPDACGHIAPLLNLLASRLGKDAGDLKVYDPYYCSGAVQRHLGALGFKQVYNECEDFYARLADGAVPEHDVVVTSPAYSESSNGRSHTERLLRFCVKEGKPFLVLMPEPEAAAPYYTQLFAKHPPPLLLAPPRRYQFWMPREFLAEGEGKKGYSHPKLGMRRSPFASLWYLSLAPVMPHKELMKQAKAGHLKGIQAVSRKAPEVIAEGDAAAEAIRVGAVETAEDSEPVAPCSLCWTPEQVPNCCRTYKRLNKRKAPNVAPDTGQSRLTSQSERASGARKEARKKQKPS